MQNSSKMKLITGFIIIFIGLLFSLQFMNLKDNPVRIPDASGDMGKLYVTVKDKDGNSITDNHEWVNITVYFNSNIIGSKNLTVGSDVAEIYGVGDSTYQVVVRHPSYTTSTQNVKTKDSQNTYITIKLYRPGEEPNILGPLEISLIIVLSAGAVIVVLLILNKKGIIKLKRDSK